MELTGRRTARSGEPRGEGGGSADDGGSDGRAEHSCGFQSRNVKEKCTVVWSETVPGRCPCLAYAPGIIFCSGTV